MGCAAAFSWAIRSNGRVAQTLSWWDVPGRFQCQPFRSSLGTTGCDLEPAFGCPRNHHTNRKSHKVKSNDTHLVLSRHQPSCQWMWNDSLAPYSPVYPSTTPWLLPLFLLSTKRKINSTIFHDLPCFPAYAPLTLEEKANYTELLIKFFTYICTAKWTSDLGFSRLNLKYWISCTVLSFPLLSNETEMSSGANHESIFWNHTHWKKYDTPN